MKIAHVHGSTPKDERDDTVAALAAGDIEVITNCAVFTEGFNLPDIGCLSPDRRNRSAFIDRWWAAVFVLLKARITA